MTAIPALRPPRSSPATAYLRHLHQQKQRKGKDETNAYSPTSVVGEFAPSNYGTSSPTGVRTLVTDGHFVHKNNSSNKTLPVSPFIGSSACGVSTCSSEEYETEATDSGHSSNTYFGELEDEVFPIAPISRPPESISEAVSASVADTTTTSTALVPMPITSQVIAIETEDGSYALEALLSASSDNDDDDEVPCVDDDSLDALDRLLSETSRRWEDSAQRTHREFCRIPTCPCRTQDIIQQQAAEIEALRAQLDAHNSNRYRSGLDDEEPREDILPVEQIEVYHDSDDHLSVTSGLTHMYGDVSRVGDDCMSVLQRAPIQRPDAASVGPVQPSRVRDYQVDLVAADGTTRKAVYSGPLHRGEPHGCGILKFVDTGDLYMGDIVNGKMHGQGTYTFSAGKKKGFHKKATTKKSRVLKGTFENNVFTGWDPASARH